MDSKTLALGNILVAGGDISLAQLESALLHQTQSGRRLGEELVDTGVASILQVQRGLLLQQKLLAYARNITVGMVPLFALLPSAIAAQHSVAMSVSVTVIANAKMQTSYQTSQLQISEADVARGHIDVPTALRFSVASNSQSGYLLAFNPIGNIFESVHVSGLDNIVELGADGGDIVQRGAQRKMQMHDLSFRFTLKPDTQPGNYPWPLALSVRAL